MEMSLPMTPVAFSPSVPKYGTLIPNRIFVGGIANDTTESELKHFFSAFGIVKDCKIILDRAGLSKSYGFVTFESQEDAEKVLKRMSDTLMLRDRKLNIGPAIRKQQMSSRLIADQAISPPGHTLLYSNGSASVPYSLPNGLAIYCAADGNSYLVPAQQQPQATIYHPTMMSSYYSAQPNFYQSQPAAAAPAQWSNPAAGQWRWNSPVQPSQSGPSLVSPGQYVYPVHPAALMPAELIYPPNGQSNQPTDSGDA